MEEVGKVEELRVRTKSKTKRLAEDLANGNNEFNVSKFDRNYT